MTNSYFALASDELQQSRNFVHVHPSEFVLTAAGKGVCIFIATRILTQEFYDFLSKRYFFYRWRNRFSGDNFNDKSGKLNVAPVALRNEPMTEAHFDENCSQISPVDTSLVDENVFC